MPDTNNIRWPSCKNGIDHELRARKERERLIVEIEAFHKAFSTDDTQTLETMITDQCIHLNGNSKSIGKKEWLDYLKKRKQ